MVSEGVCDNDRTAKPRAANLSQSYPTLPAWRLVSASMACRREMFDRFDFTRSDRAFSLQRFHKEKKESESKDWELVYTERRTKNMRLRRIPPRGTSSPETPGAVHARRGAIS